MPSGRFAPSPTGRLHLGNLRTALLAWLCARSTDSSFVVRIEDLDPVASSVTIAEQQLADLAAIGLDWDGPVVWQSTRLEVYRSAVADLQDRDLVYPCWCSRREIAEATQAPNRPDLPDGAYPGTCARLDSRARAERWASRRPPAWRLRADGATCTLTDDVCGPYSGVVDDFVIQRGDGMPAYNLAVVVDDAAQRIEQVVRGDDLLSSTPRQEYLASLLGLPQKHYAHVPLVLGPTGQRLAKRDGAVTLDDQRALGRSAGEIVAMLAESLGLGDEFNGASSPTAADLLSGFDLKTIRRQPWVWHGSSSASGPADAYRRTNGRSGRETEGD